MNGETIMCVKYMHWEKRGRLERGQEGAREVRVVRKLFYDKVNELVDVYRFDVHIGFEWYHNL